MSWNAPSSDSEGTEFQPNLEGYVRPGANRVSGPDPYVWTVYRQTRRVDNRLRPQGGEDQFPGFFEFRQLDFAREWDLVGPVAMSWVRSKQDVWTNQYLTDFGFDRGSQLATCATLLEERLRKEADFIARDIGQSVEPESLRMFLFVKFSDGSWADPFSKAVIRSSAQRTFPKLYPVYRLDQPTMDDFVGHAYTIAVVRAERQNYLSFAVRPLVFLHSLEVNVRLAAGVTPRDGKFWSQWRGEMDYQGPTSAGYVAGTTAYLLVYEQPNSEDVRSDPSDLFDENCGTSYHRCRFDLQAFVRQENLSLVGISRWRIETTRVGFAPALL